LASWSLTGGWIPNSNIIVIKKACTNVKHFFGNAWIALIKSFQVPTDGCPLPVVM